MITAEVLFERLSTLPARDNFDAASLLVVRDPQAFERLSFVLGDPEQARRLAGLPDGAPLALRLHLRRRQGGGFAARVVEVVPTPRPAS